MFSPKSRARPSSGDAAEPAAGHSRSASVASEADSLAEARDVSGASSASRIAIDDVAPFPAPPRARAPSSSGGESEDDADDPDADDDSMDVMGAAARVGVAPSDAETQTYRNFDLAVRMSAEMGVREHRRHLKKHKACFTGRAAVQWMIDAGVAEDVPAAVARGAALVDAGLVRGVTAGRAFQNRSFLYRFNVAMDPGLQAARWCLSREMTKMQGRVHDVCSVVDRHTAATRAIATDHAAAMERLEKVLVDVRTQLAYTRAACFMIAAACASLLALRAVEEDAAAAMGSGVARSFRSWAAAAGAAAGWEARLRAAAAVAAFALFALAAAFVTDRKSLDVVLHTAGVEGWTDPWADEDDDEDDVTTEVDSVAARASRVGRRASATRALTTTTTATTTAIVPGTPATPVTPAAPASIRVASGSVAATSSSTPRTPGSATRDLRRLGSIQRLIRGVSASVSSPGGRRSVSAESLGADGDKFVHRALPPPAVWSGVFAAGAGAGAGAGARRRRSRVGRRRSSRSLSRRAPRGIASDARHLRAERRELRFALVVEESDVVLRGDEMSQGVDAHGGCLVRARRGERAERADLALEARVGGLQVSDALAEAPGLAPVVRARARAARVFRVVPAVVVQTRARGFGRGTGDEGAVVPVPPSLEPVAALGGEGAVVLIRERVRLAVRHRASRPRAVPPTGPGRMLLVPLKSALGTLVSVFSDARCSSRATRRLVCRSRNSRDDGLITHWSSLEFQNHTFYLGDWLLASFLAACLTRSTRARAGLTRFEASSTSAGRDSGLMIFFSSSRSISS